MRFDVKRSSTWVMLLASVGLTLLECGAVSMFTRSLVDGSDHVRVAFK